MFYRAFSSTRKYKINIKVVSFLSKKSLCTGTLFAITSVHIVYMRETIPYYHNILWIVETYRIYGTSMQRISTDSTKKSY